MECDDRRCGSAGTRLPARCRVVDTQRLRGWDGRGRPAGARCDARCGAGGLSGIRETGPGLREGGSPGPDWRPSGTARAHGSGGCENGAQRAHSGRCDAPGRAAIWFAPRREHGAVRSLVTAPCRCPLRNRGAAVARRAAGARRFADRACTCPAVRSWSPRAEFCESLWTGDGFCHQPPVGPWCFDALGQMGCFVRRCTASGGRCRDQPISEMYGRLDRSIPRSAGERVPRHSRRREGVSGRSSTVPGAQRFHDQAHGCGTIGGREFCQSVGGPGFRRARVFRGDGAASPVITVVGLVGDIHFREHRQATPMIIRPYRQGLAQGSLVIRTRRDLAALLPAIRRAVQAVDPDAALVDARTMDDVIAPQLVQPRLNSLLLSAFAFAAVLLAAIGLYGIMASAVSQQTRELGVRLALGAAPDRLRAMILRQALTVAGAGALAGLLAALAGSRLLTTMLFEVSPTDPVALLWS